MSTHVVSENCINRVITAFIRAGSPKVSKSRTDYAKHRDALGRELLRMNADAVIARYGDNRADSVYDWTVIERYTYDAPSDLPTVGPNVSKATDAQLLKSVDCLLYQCSEGDVPDYTLYRDLEEVANTLAHLIVTRLEEYHAAEWG